MEYKINSNCSGVEWKKIQFQYYVSKDSDCVFGYYQGKWYRKDKRNKTIELIKDVPYWRSLLEDLNSQVSIKEKTHVTNKENKVNYQVKNENVKGTIEFNVKKYGTYTLMFIYVVIGYLIISDIIIPYFKNSNSTNSQVGNDYVEQYENENHENENHEFSNNEYRTPHEIEVENSFFDDTIYHNQTKQVEVGGDDLYGQLLKTVLSGATDPEIAKQKRREFDRRPKFKTYKCGWCPNGQFTINKYDYPDEDDVPSFCSKKCKSEYEEDKWVRENLRK